MVVEKKHKWWNFRNYLVPAKEEMRTDNADPRKLALRIAKVQLQRTRQDILSWRSSVDEAENAWYPHRVKMQRLFQDTILNGHVKGCMNKRKDLTLLKEFCFKKGDTENEELAEMFKGQWFRNLVNYMLDARFFGYSLVNFNGISNNKFDGIELIKRWNISPDRLQVSTYTYSLDGTNFMDEPYWPWIIWVPTPTETGASKCGYGILYEVALYEIFCRNLLGFNADFVELYAQPLRVGKTSKTEEQPGRADFEAAVEGFGSSGWAVIDPMDDISLIESKLGGTGYNGYDNLEKRCEAKISKLILGHSDAMDSTPGKLGKNEEIDKALLEKEKDDNSFIEDIINEQLIPKMKQLGFAIPEGYKFYYKNNKEIQEAEEKALANQKALADIAQVMKNSGLKMDPKYFEERTGIPTEEIEEKDPEQDKRQAIGYSKNQDRKIDEFYNDAKRT